MDDFLIVVGCMALAYAGIRFVGKLEDAADPGKMRKRWVAHLTSWILAFVVSATLRSLGFDDWMLTAIASAAIGFSCAESYYFDTVKHLQKVLKETYSK